MIKVGHFYRSKNNTDFIVKILEILESDVKIQVVNNKSGKDFLQPGHVHVSRNYYFNSENYTEVFMFNDYAEQFK